MFHPCENPSVYTDPSGKLRMLANYGSNGMWESESVDGGWRCISPGFPPGGDCTFFFRWGKFDYIIGGFTGLWSKPADAPNSAYEDVARKGLDFYDGLGVPAITGISDGRFLMAGWIPIRGWGGNLVIRELIQFPDGRIGSKWMKEITPATEPPRTLAAQCRRNDDRPRGQQVVPAGLRRSAGRGQAKAGSAFRCCRRVASRLPASCRFAWTICGRNSVPVQLNSFAGQREVPARRRRAAWRRQLRDREPHRRR